MGSDRLEFKVYQIILKFTKRVILTCFKIKAYTGLYFVYGIHKHLFNNSLRLVFVCLCFIPLYLGPTYYMGTVRILEMPIYVLLRLCNGLCPLDLLLQFAVQAAAGLFVIRF